MILSFYLEAVKKLNSANSHYVYATCIPICTISVGCPETIRIDRGVENTKVAQCQIALRMFHLDRQSQEKSVYFGPSPTNSVRVSRILILFCGFRVLSILQRIESWWSRLRILKSDWWIQHFKVILLAIAIVFYLYVLLYRVYNERVFLIPHVYCTSACFGSHCCI